MRIEPDGLRTGCRGSGLRRRRSGAGTLALAAAVCAALLMGRTGNAAEPAPPRKLQWYDSFPGVVHDGRSIRGFTEEYRWLSNFYPCPVTVDGLRFGSAEGAYQAGKFPLAERGVFTGLDPDSAKKLAHSRTIDEAAWDRRKDDVMRAVVWAKFSQNPELGDRLLATGNRQLEETNWWGDPYWGTFEGKGLNRLGQILMETRARLAGERKRN